MAKASNEAKDSTEICGILMPIADYLDYSEKHWADVRDIIERAAKDAGLNPNPVWESADTDIIQGRIIRNLYNYPVAVCDISGLNPNVMFELGLRLAFKKPVIIMIDSSTKIPFDTNVIEHIVYKRSLHFQSTEELIDRLSKKLTSILRAVESKSYQAYIDAFGVFTTVELDPQRIEVDQFILDKLDKLSANVGQLAGQNRSSLLEMHRDSLLQDRMDSSSRKHYTRKSWTLNDEAVVKKMWENGNSPYEISSLLGGYTAADVAHKATRLGLTRRDDQDIG